MEECPQKLFSLKLILAEGKTISAGKTYAKNQQFSKLVLLIISLLSL